MSIYESYPEKSRDTSKPIGSNSRLFRFLVVTLLVALYIITGIYLHLNKAEYQILGVPLLIFFQTIIHRQPLRTLWVRSGKPIVYNVRFFAIWFAFSLYPVYEIATYLEQSNPSNAALWGITIIGAFGFSYALNNMRFENYRQLALCILTVILLGGIPTILQFIGHHSAANFSLSTILEAAGTTILFLPAGFMVEEVFFRGALDTYIHRGEKGTGWISAIYVSALWGLWHLPGQIILPGHLISTILALVISQILIGVPLSYWWRKSGNLTVNDTAHALLDTIRNVLAAIA